MKKQESISWILDRPHTEIEELERKYPDKKEYLKHHGIHFEESIRRRIEFVHSLGLKCDCVGWCSLDLDRPDIDEILDKIEAFCKEGGWLARGGYGCRYTDFDSDWYEIFADSNDYSSTDQGSPYAIRAYSNRNKPFLYGWGCKVPAVVSEKFREVCLKHNIPGIDFCWAKDIGKYEATQYAFMYPRTRLKTIACDFGLRYSDQFSPYRKHDGSFVYRHTRDYVKHGRHSKLYRRLQKIGGHLPRLAEIFYDFQFNLQDYYCAK